MEKINCRRTEERKKELDNFGTEVIWFEIEDNILPSCKVQAKITDYCEDGMGLCTQANLKPGKRIRFVSKQRNSNIPDEGIIMWTTISQEGCKAGVKFSNGR